MPDTPPRSDKPAEGSLQARANAYRSWAHTQDRAARTRPAREGFETRFETEVDPEGTLPEDERARRAAYARKAYFLELSAKAAKARARRRTARHEDDVLADTLRAAAAELDGNP